MIAAQRAALESSRALLLRMAAGLSDEACRTAYAPDFSPIGWHLGHVAWQQEVWALRRLGGRAPIAPALDGLYDSFRSEKRGRGARLPPLDAILAYGRRVLEGVLEVLEDPPDPASPLLRRAWVFRFLANHERQHAESVAAVRLLGGLPLGDAEPAPSAEADAPSWLPTLEVEGGFAPIGCDSDPDGWDNERSAHPVELPAFRLARDPVTCGAWLEFLLAGGYRDDRLWSGPGRRWRDAHGVDAPLHWERDADGAWRRRSLAGPKPLGADEPVAHVSFFEAEAFARFAGARLPTELEWERAASWDGARKRRWPWGDDPAGAAGENLGARLLDVRPSGGAPAPCGARSMAGNVWEWTASEFRPWPGFAPDPYRGYSEPWFGDAHRVLRGGCHLSDPAMARCAFRNWFEPSVRAFPSGVRLASDARAP